MVDAFSRRGGCGKYVANLSYQNVRRQTPHPDDLFIIQAQNNARLLPQKEIKRPHKMKRAHWVLQILQAPCPYKISCGMTQFAIFSGDEMFSGEADPFQVPGVEP